jgi:hypothetical protein
MRFQEYTPLLDVQMESQIGSSTTASARIRIKYVANWE